MHKKSQPPSTPDLPTKSVWALVVLMCSFLFLAAALASAFMKDRIEKSAASEIHVLATTLSAQVEQTLHSADGILDSMFAEASKAANTPDEFSAYFGREDVFKSYSNRIADKPFIDVASFIDVEGNVVNFTRSFPAPPINLAERDYFKAVGANGFRGVYLSSPVENKGNGKWVFYLAKGVRSNSGTFIGVVIVGLSIETFEAFFKRITNHLGRNAAIVLTKEDATVLARWPMQGGTIGQMAFDALASTLRDAPRGPPEANLSSLDSSLKASIHRIAGFPLVISCVINPDFYFNPWINAAGTLLALALIASAAIIYVGAGMARFERLNRFQREQLNREIEERKKSQNELKELNEHLESSVDARTRSIAHKNDELSTAMTELKALQNRLIQTETLAALGRVVAGVAHEVNTPIGNALLVATTLKDQHSGFLGRLASGSMKRSDLAHFSEFTDSAITSIVLNLNRSAELIRNFKLVASDQAGGTRRIFPLDEPCAAAVTTVAHAAARQSVQLIFTQTQTPMLNSYPGAIEQLIVILVTNALMHAFPDPTDPVDSKDPEREAEINIRIGSTGPDFVGILFEDNGCGIPQEAIERIYEPFFTTKIGQGGTGLGLSIAHTLVSKKLGGIIQVESGPWGTRFNIEFPLMAPNRSESSI